MDASSSKSDTPAATITEHEAKQVERANATGKQPVVFVHGLWLLPSSWDRWATVFEEAGYIALTPSWPDDPETVAEANAKPEVFAHKTVGQVADHFGEIIRGLTKKPAIVGHSFGGLLVQILAGRGLATATVAVDRALLPRACCPLPLLRLEIGAGPCSTTRPIATAPFRSPTTSFASLSPTPSPRWRPRSCTTPSPCLPRACRCSRPRPPTSTPGPRRRSTARTPTAGRCC